MSSVAPPPPAGKVRTQLLQASGGPAHETLMHAHGEGQLFAVRSGTMVVRTAGGCWAHLPGRIGWIPPCQPHGASYFGPVTGWSLYVAADLCTALPDAPTVLGLTPLIDALIDRLAALSLPPGSPDPRCERLAAVLLDELGSTSNHPVCLPLPRDARLVRLATALLAEPDNRATLEDWASAIGMAKSTLMRQFQKETGLSFGQWRQQARLYQALALLSEGQSVTAVALSVGYDSVSAFIDSFRRHFGATPTVLFPRSRLRPGPG